MPNSDHSDVPSAQNDRHSARQRLLGLLLDDARERRKTAHTIADAGECEGPIPLSYAQERLWFLEQVGLAGATYNMWMSFRLKGYLDFRALERSVSELIRRHECLRTRFEAKDGVPHQVVEPVSLFELRLKDLSHLRAPQEREQQLLAAIHIDQQWRFDLSREVPFRALLIELGETEHVLLLTVHHIACDGWSLGVVAREISVLYTAFVRGQPSALPEVAIQYRHYAIWQRRRVQQEVMQRELTYWGEQLRGSPPHLQLPLDRARPATERFRGATCRFELPESL